MVTSRQFARGMVRTMRAIDRDAKRAQRQRIAYEKAAQKQALLESSAAAAAEYDRMIEAIVGAHRVPLDRRDWHTLATKPETPEPAPLKDREHAARWALESYEPGWFARTFGLEARRRNALSLEVERARAADQEDWQSRKAEAHKLNEAIQMARRLLDVDHAAIVQALEEYSRLGDLPFAVEAIDVLFTDDKRVIAVVDGLDLEDMPDQSVTLLQSGKASVKALPKGRVLELHRLNICSAAVRVAIEFMNTLPIEAVEVIMQTDLLDRGSGHVEAEPVLYLRVTPQALSTVNLERAEADALVERLGGHLEWGKRDGFRTLNLAPFDIPTQRTIED